jgi:hypothetical protein
MSKRLLSSSVLILGSLIFFAGCQQKLVPPTPPTETQTEAEPLAQPTKEGYATLKGIIVKLGSNFVVIDELDAQHEIDSYSLDFNQYIDTEVSVTGQYSGETLFVSEIEAIPTPTY